MAPTMVWFANLKYIRPITMISITWATKLSIVCFLFNSFFSRNNSALIFVNCPKNKWPKQNARTSLALTSVVSTKFKYPDLLSSSVLFFSSR